MLLKLGSLPSLRRDTIHACALLKEQVYSVPYVHVHEGVRPHPLSILSFWTC